ncbi:MAG: tRNA (N6-threonylcarbamoyladenosine(37)-N6)-methyltransferase TrmO [Candidatus Caldarchaeum sp.]|nr:tRNA (N6-threonylcarbamoyladenosine(37)-N6)-methyltransferase TrmO [Candidatus Caldarchaeum sp.]
MEEIVLRPVGVVRHGMPFDKSVEWDRWRNPSTIEVFPEYGDGLRGLEEYSHVFVLFFLHLEKRVELLIRPRGRPDMPVVGIFASRSPVRPNPVGLAVCRLVEVSGNIVRVLGLDAYTGTPVIDIKPYDYYDVVEKPKVPEWFEKLWREREGW